MIRKAIIVILTTLALGAAILWLVQLAGPIHFCKGPKFRDVRWVITTNVPGGPSWGMYDPTGVEMVFSATPGSRYPWSAVEVPKEEAPPMDGKLPEDCLLLGIGFGYLHLGLADFNSVPAPIIPPAPGMVYVSSSHVAVALPLWMLMLACSIYPTVTLVRGPLRRWRRRRKGCCVTCGYDLTGNVSGRCPECGEAA